MEGDVGGAQNKTLPKVKQEEVSIESLETLDTIPLSLSPVENEILILFVNEIGSFSSLYIQRIIQMEYLFHIADKETHILEDESKCSSYLLGFIEAFRRYKEPVSERERVEAIKKLEEYLLPEGKVNAEMKRLKLTTEVNKLVPKAYSIPSYKTINTALNLFEKKGYIQKSQIDKKTLWYINQDFYQKWKIRRQQLSDEHKQKIKEFQNITPGQATINANEYMLKKYGMLVLDFYGIFYIPFRPPGLPNVIYTKNALYFKYRADVSLFLPR